MAASKSNTGKKGRVIGVIIFLVALVVVLYSATVLRDYRLTSGVGLLPELEAKIPVPSAAGLSVSNQVPEKLILNSRVPAGCDVVEFRVSRFKNMAFGKDYRTSSGMKEVAMLSGGKRYYVQVRVYKFNPSGRRVHGKWSVVREATVKKKPKQ